MVAYTITLKSPSHKVYRSANLKPASATSNYERDEVHSVLPEEIIAFSKFP